MSYIQDSLGANEKVHYIAHFHWTRYAFGYGVLIIAAIAGIASLNSDYPGLALAPIIVGGVLFVWLMTPIWTTEIGVTNQRVIFKRGLLNRVTEELQLGSVEEVSLSQDFLGRIMNWGRIDIHGSGGEDLALPIVGDPVGLRRALQDAVGGVQETAPLPPRGAMPQGA